MISCEELVIADGQVVRQLLKDFNVSPESMLPLNSFDEFEKRLQYDKNLAKTYGNLKELYQQSVAAGFKILPDNFGGFGLFNHTGRVLKPSIEPLRPFPVGLVKNVPCELQDEMSDLSVMRGELDTDELVLLGPIRFANHSCSPNTQFFLGYTSPLLQHNKCVFLKVISSIQPFEEITVSYGSNYFKDGRLKCRCPHKDKHIVSPGNPQESFTPPVACPSPKCTELPATPIDLFQSSTQNESFQTQYSASQSSAGTPNLLEVERKRGILTQRKRKVKRRLVDTASRQIRTFIHQVDSSQSSELESVLDENEMNTTDHATPDSIENEPEDASGEDASSVSKSESDEDSSKESETEEDQFVFSQDPLSCNTNVTAHNASMGLYGIAARHCLPDKALFDLLTWHKIVHPRDILPAPNYIKNETNKLTERYIAGTETNGTGEVIFLSFADKLQENVEKYITEILAYANPDTKTDLKLTALFDGNALNVKLILNTDGVRVQESSDCSAYPVWVALADLPPKLRSYFDNIHLCSLWYGKGSIDWDSIFKHYLSEVSKDRKIKVNGVDYELKFQTVFVILDLVCKHDVLQMKKFNGYYGCGLCTMRGVQRYPGGRSYPNNQSFTMRDPGMHEYLVRQFESGSVEERKARKEKDPEIDTLGVKGRSYLF